MRLSSSTLGSTALVALIVAIVFHYAVAVTPAPARAAVLSPQSASLDTWAGKWDIFDARGKRIGHSIIIAQVPGSMLFELRTIGDGDPQPLWFENSEEYRGWTQLFVGTVGLIRAFKPYSPPDAWPMVLGSDVVLRDRTTAKFRMTITPRSSDEVRRLLEISKNGGRTWDPVFDYRYKRSD